ncbi:MAG: hypothetical protein JOZ65_17730 [Chloroflexi bacterium]|nr:hypothetical protein [Chloroflexota bacterium]
MDGGVQQASATDKRAVVFPYTWDLRQQQHWDLRQQQHWPPQLPRTLRLFDRTGTLLSLPTSLVASAAAD